jgi:lysozyme
LPAWLLVGLVLACGGDGDPPSADVAPYPGPKTRTASRSARPHALGPGTHLGLDVSHHSGEIDWQAVADQGYDFVFIKASEGVDDPDPEFHEHWRRAAEVGLARGAYHFYVTEDDPEAQADLFFSTVDLRPGDLVPVVDIEVLGKGTQQVELPEELRRFLDILETRTGVTPILYTPPHFWDTHIHESFSRYPLWVAEYGVEAPELPEGWAGWVIWQFEGDAGVPGIEKGADRSRTRPEVDLDALRIPFRLR